MSVYLPDDLEEQVKRDSLPASQVIQHALRRHLEQDGASWGQPPSDAAERIAAGAAHLVAQAREDYQAGYDYAIEQLPRLHWRALDELEFANFDLGRWAAQLRVLVDAAEQGNLESDIGIEAMSTLWFDLTGITAMTWVSAPTDAEPGRATVVTKSDTWRRGYLDGLRAIRAAVVRDITGEAKHETRCEPAS